MISIEDCAALEVNNLSEYDEKRTERLLRMVEDEQSLGQEEKEIVILQRRYSCEEKALHGQFVTGTEEAKDQKGWKEVH